MFIQEDQGRMKDQNIYEKIHAYKLQLDDRHHVLHL
jgi:hypothetical protein